MNYKKIYNKPLVKDLLLSILFGFLSLILGYVKFKIPGLDGYLTDLREIPLLISILYLRNWAFLFLIILISTSDLPEGVSFVTTFIMHIFPLILFWFSYKLYLSKQKNIIKVGVIWLILSAIYYLIFMLPIMIIVNKFIGIEGYENFTKSYIPIVSSTSFEILATITITALYLVQFKTTKELNEKVNWLNIIIKSNDVGFWTFNLPSEIFKYNNNWNNIFKENKSNFNLPLNELSKLIHPGDKETFKQKFDESISIGHFRLEHRIKNKDGDWTWILSEAKVIRRDIENKPLTYAGLHIDINSLKVALIELEEYKNHLEFLVQERTEELETSNEELSATNEELFYQKEELKAALKDLQSYQRQLIEAEKMVSIGMLASGVAHEINNPLNFIQGGVNGIENYIADNLEEHVKEVAPLINAVYTGIERATGIIKSLNHYSSDNISNNDDCNINSILENCITTLKKNNTQDIEIIKEGSNAPIIIKGNERKLFQAFLNILTNAVQSITKNGIIHIRTKIESYKIKIYIEDNGQGIEEKNLTKITDPFFTTKEVGKGTGLGLSVSKKIFEDHNGIINFESKINKGTIVKITFLTNN